MFIYYKNNLILTKVLSANSEAMKHIGSGKVLKSNSADNIFIYYSTEFTLFYLKIYYKVGEREY